MPKAKKATPKVFPRRLMVGLVVFALFIGVAATSGYYAVKEQVLGASTKASTPEVELAEIIKKIENHALLPDETPTVATVSDATKLSDERFFDDARNGDIVVIYKDAKKAILYRPSVDRIIEMGPVVPTSNK